MKLYFHGKVTCGDSSRVSTEEQNAAVLIGGEDVVDEVYELPWKDSVVAILNGKEVARGKAVSDIGCGYSDWTPMESDAIKIGGTDLINIIDGYEGMEIDLIITDEN